MLVEELKGGCYVPVHSAGATSSNGTDPQKAVRHCLPGDSVHINTVDSGGELQVLSDRGFELGVIEGETGRSIAHALAAGVPVRAVVNSIHGQQTGDRRLVLLVDVEEPHIAKGARFRQWLFAPLGKS
jgi:hypothetical protein